MKLLVIGGTSFVGRHAVEHAVAEGHDVTVFNRGRTNADLLGDRISHLVGDRNTPDYSTLDTVDVWDAVIDVSAYVPRHVHQLADVVADRTGHYVHVSSISAYDDDSITPDEDAALHADIDDPTNEEVSGDTYGPLKAMCERVSLARFGADRTAIVRPTYVVGPHDHTDRFTYWVRRMARGGDVAVVFPDAPLQVVDGRDLGAFMVHCAHGATGAFDAAGPSAPLADVLSSIAPAGVDHRLVDVGGDQLVAHGVTLPLLSPEPAPPAFMERPAAGARAAGLTTRSLDDTVVALRRWDADRGEPDLVTGPTPEQERELLASSG